ncbi:MAG: hypothetical protein JWP78_339 [Mucilaginibacter sp.]|nr:hypothetical protein [Mucilaginibacter sp.]
METKEMGIRAVTHSKICPVHHVTPVLNIGNDHITIRCCCDFLTREYVSDLESKLKGNTIRDLINTWETDLAINELQAK